MKGLSELLGFRGHDLTERLTPRAQMALLLARTTREGQTYAGTVPHAEKERRRAANRRARASRRTNRGRR